MSAAAVHSAGGGTSRTPPTAEQLALAWRHINRPGAPATLEAALAHPAYGPCIRAHAKQLSRRGVDGAAPPVTAPARSAPPPPKVLRLGTFDPKRAAANDRDE